MNEIKKALILIGAATLFLVTILVIAVTSSNNSEEIYNQFESAFNGSKDTLIYIGRPTCGYCNLLDPSLKDLKARYEFDYVYVNTDEMNESHINQVMSKLGLTKLGTPYLAIVSNGKVVDTQNGYADYDVTFKFLQENSIIAEDAELLLNYIGLEDYKKLLKSKEAEIIVVGQSTCGYCVQAKLVLNNIAEDKEIEINYLNVSYLTKDEGAEFEESLEYFQGEWGTPVTLIVKNGKIVDMLEQFVSESEYIKFFEENGVL